jgi:hypothetical protein
MLCSSMPDICNRLAQQTPQMVHDYVAGVLHIISGLLSKQLVNAKYYTKRAYLNNEGASIPRTNMDALSTY